MTPGNNSETPRRKLSITHRTFVIRDKLNWRLQTYFRIAVCIKLRYISLSNHEILRARYKREMCTGFRWGKPNARDRSENLGVDGNIILKRMLNRFGMGKCYGIFWKQWRTLWLLKMWDVSRLAVQRLASEDGLYLMCLVKLRNPCVFLKYGINICGLCLLLHSVNVFQFDDFVLFFCPTLYVMIILLTLDH
jgi:hypothetical protein